MAELTWGRAGRTIQGVHPATIRAALGAERPISRGTCDRADRRDAAQIVFTTNARKKKGGIAPAPESQTYDLMKTELSLLRPATGGTFPRNRRCSLLSGFDDFRQLADGE